MCLEQFLGGYVIFFGGVSIRRLKLSLCKAPTANSFQLHFPARGWKRLRQSWSTGSHFPFQLHFPARGWKPLHTAYERSHLLSNFTSPQGDGNGQFPKKHQALEPNFPTSLPRKGMETDSPTTRACGTFSFPTSLPRKGMETPLVRFC